MSRMSPRRRLAPGDPLLSSTADVPCVYNRVRAMKFTRITARPAVCTGKPCIRDLRFPVSRLLGLLAARQTPEQILAAYPYLEAADIDEALHYAASLAEDETVEIAG